jgi:bis(5'-nucleosidyl)-tetraphosphatase
MFTFEKAVGAVIFRKENNQIKFLILDHGENYWNFPKGHAEEGEIEEQTLRREVAEETGIKELTVQPNFKRKIYYFYRALGTEKVERIKMGRKINVFKTVIFYLAETQMKEVRVSSEHIGFAWLDFSAALQKLNYKTSQKILRQAQKELEKSFAKKESLG